jgi:putative ABC transport system permease protein
VIGQVALALVLLVGSGLMLRSFAALQHVDLGFRPEGLLTFRYSLPESRYEDGVARMAFHRDLLDRIEATPGVVSAGVISGLPLTQAKSATPMEAVDHPAPSGSLAPIIEQRQVSPGYFATMGIDIVDGRPLEWEDRADGLRGIVISEALARAFWPGESAVGRMIRGQGEDNDAWEVVGVARDVRFDGVEDEPLPLAYWPMLNGDVDEEGSSPSAVDMVVRVAGGDPLDALSGMGAAMRELDARLPVINPRTVQDVVGDSLSSASFTALLLGIAAAVALLLGTVGLYGVISFIVGRRTQEIGVRMALGASSRSVMRQVVRQGMTLTSIGLAVGLVGAWGVSRVLGSLLYGVTSNDPVTFVGTALLLGGVALIATWIPAHRAANVDPVEALRGE